MSQIFKGSCVALITPFDKNGINFAEVEYLIEFQIREGTNALLVLGTTGEASTMTSEEKKSLIDFTLAKVNGRVPVIVGTGSNNTAQAIKDSIYAQEAGANGVLIITPYYNKATQNGIIAHFTAIADSINIPAILYNVPGRTGLNLQPKTLDTLLRHNNITGIKEASGNIEQICEMVDICRKHGKNFYSGDDGITYLALALGGQGVISVAANIIPAAMSELCSSYFSGNIGRSRQLHSDIFELVKSLFIEVNPIPVKTAAGIMGLCSSELRLPLTPMEEKNKEMLINSMKKFSIL